MGTRVKTTYFAFNPRLCLIILLLCCSGLQAGPLYKFQNNGARLRFQHLTQRLRCLVCQNQNLAESQAPLAADLRQTVYHLIQQGDSDDKIRDYLVHRYGDFILYTPPMKRSTALLWLAPVFFLLVGSGILCFGLRRKT